MTAYRFACELAEDATSSCAAPSASGLQVHCRCSKACQTEAAKIQWQARAIEYADTPAKG